MTGAVGRDEADIQMRLIGGGIVFPAAVPSLFPTMFRGRWRSGSPHFQES
jgi:hypothetical protein